MNIYKSFENKDSMSRSEVFDMVENVWNTYRKLSKDEKITEHNNLLLFIEKMMNKHDDSEAWSVYFVPAKNIFKDILLLEKKVKAISIKETFLSTPENSKEVLLEMAAQILVTSIDEPYFEDYKKVWQDVFKDIPSFESALQKCIEKTLLNRKQILDKYSNNNVELNIDVKKYENLINIPMKCSVKKFFNNDDFIEHRKEIITEFNSFKMEGYMKIPSNMFKILESEYFEDGNNLTVRYMTNKKLEKDDTEVLLKQVVAQISYGYGNNVQQRPILIDNKIVYLRFDEHGISMKNNEVQKTKKNTI